MMCSSVLCISRICVRIDGETIYALRMCLTQCLRKVADGENAKIMAKRKEADDMEALKKGAKRIKK